MKDRLRNIRLVLKYMGVWNYFVHPLLPFLVFVCLPSVLLLIGIATARTAFTVLLATVTALHLYNWCLIISAIHHENDDMENRRWAISFGQILCIIVGTLLARLVGFL